MAFYPDGPGGDSGNSARGEQRPPAGSPPGVADHRSQQLVAVLQKEVHQLRTQLLTAVGSQAKRKRG